MGTLHWLIPLILGIISLSPSISFGQTQSDPKEKDIKSLFFNPKVGPEEIKRVAILSIRSEEEGIRHASRIEDLLLTNLKTVGKYDILSAQDVKGLVEKRGMDWTKRHHYPKALEIGKSLGVDGVIVGSLSEYGTMGDRAHFALNLRMIRIPEGDTAWSMSCSARGKPKEMKDMAEGAIGSIVRTLVHRWRSEGATMAWGIKLQPLEASGGYSHIILRVPPYEEAEIEEYIVSRGTSKSGPYAEIKRLATKKRGSLSFKDDDAQADRGYFYHYRVVTKMGFLSPPSEAVEARLGKTPPTPSALSAEGGRIREIRLAWEKSPDREVAGYKIYRSQHPDRDYRLVASLKDRDKTQYVDKGNEENPLGDTVQYFYRIAAYYPSGNESKKSEAASATTKGKPSPPRGLTATSDVIREVPLSWNPNPEPEVEGYRVYRSDSKGGPYSIIGKMDGRSKTSFVDSQGLMDKAEYYYRITAVNVADVEGDPSEPVSVATRGIPLAPQGLTAKAGMVKSVSIEWTPPPDPEVRGYIVYRSLSPEGPFEEIQKIKGEKKTSFLDGGPLKKKLTDGSLYYYKVRSYNKVDVLSPDSEMVSARTKKVPRAPGELNALGGQARRISLTWGANPEKDIKRYIVYRSEDAGEGFKKITTVPGDGTDFIDTKRSDGATYYYKMTTVDADGLESEFSEVVSATTKRVPSNPQGIKADGTRRKVIISWEANPEADISRYHIYRKIAFGFKKIGSTEGTSYTDEKLRDGKTYTYKLTAEDKDGLKSPFSGEISATTAPK